MEYLGLDVGSSYLKIWLENDSRELISCACIQHKGSPKSLVFKELSQLDRMPDYLCYCGNLQGRGISAWSYDGLLAEIDYLKECYPQRHLLIFGAEKVELVRYDDNGRILSLQANPPCAAGTGSFLDEQVSRLGLNPAELGQIAIDENAPLVASRCAVFAKTDLIHLQQEGYSAQAMYNGLCKGLVISGLKSVFGGKIPDGEDILLSGGLLANPHIEHFLGAMLPRAMPVTAPLFSRAKGLCNKARLLGTETAGFIRGLEAVSTASPITGEALSLELVKSSFPSREMTRARDTFGNEIWHDIRPGEALDVYLGVDVGSTSTKAVFVDRSDRIRLDIYTRTSGNPIEATRSIFSGICLVQDSLGCTCRVRGCSTTGSGRLLIGRVIGADLIINEITAHATGAKTVDESVETIFEIGGQDAKFIRIEQGRIVDVNMNYVCAAGTGSFIEEQAHTLGIGLDEISELVMGISPLANSDRCTVFMNQEITRQLALGYPKERIMAGVLFAVFKNYLNKVVGNRYYRRDSIVFQGATARNRGLVAALEQLTGAQIRVSPFCHVMGAYGAALLLKERPKRETGFRGFHIPEVIVNETTCKGCENTCRITRARMGSEKISWGYLCGREPGEKTRGRDPNPAMKIREHLLMGNPAPARTNHPALKIPTLPLYDEFTPLFKEIARAAPVDIEVCLPSRDEIAAELIAIGSGDFCYPIKVAMACTNVLLKKYPGHKILLPFLIKEKPDEHIHPRSLYCPFITGLASLYQQGPYEGRVFSPMIDLSRKVPWQAGEFLASLKLAGIEHMPRHTMERALAKGLSNVDRCRRNLTALGRTILERVPPEKKIIVLVGRSYNLYHRILNLGIPELIESMGYTVVPMDIIPDEADNTDVVEHFPDMYWYQGQRILRKALTIKNKPNMFPLMLSNFSCGPDSFILSYFEEISRHKPYLILELDEHGSATGYQTRIEAFCNMIEQYEGQVPIRKAVPVSRIRYRFEKMKNDTRIWIPQIHPYIPQLWAAVLQRYGFQAIPMGEETASQCNMGRAFCRGSECLPAAVTIGKFLSCIGTNDTGRDAVLFMPRAEGPCRFGQYATLQSRILDRAGIERSYIFSPTSENGYAFLNRQAELEVWRATCLGDLLFKLRCRTVPYHRQPEAAQALFSTALQEIISRVRSQGNWAETVRLLVKELCCTVDFSQPRKPLVGIVGEIFVRLNSFSNQHVVEAIEAAGGEAWLSPLAEWIHYVWELLACKGGLKNRLGSLVKRCFIRRIEDDATRLFSPVLDDMAEPSIARIFAEARRFMPVEFEGETILTLGRAKIFAGQGASLVVNCSPFGCMPGRLTSHIFRNHPDYFGVPIVNLFFDGIGDIASQVAIYLHSITQDRQHKEHACLSTFGKQTHLPGQP